MASTTELRAAMAAAADQVLRSNQQSAETNRLNHMAHNQSALSLASADNSLHDLDSIMALLETLVARLAATRHNMEETRIYQAELRQNAGRALASSEPPMQGIIAARNLMAQVAQDTSRPSGPKAVQAAEQANQALNECRVRLNQTVSDGNVLRVVSTDLDQLGRIGELLASVSQQVRTMYLRVGAMSAANGPIQAQINNLYMVTDKLALVTSALTTSRDAAKAWVQSA